MGTNEHGVSACYSNGPDGYRPTMICTCGWCEVGDTWEEVGELYDAHLDTVRLPLPPTPTPQPKGGDR
jgi:hypothetical protein